MKIRHVIFCFSLAALTTGCTNGNPLLDISDGKFKDIFANPVNKVFSFGAPTCTEKVFFPERVKPTYKGLRMGPEPIKEQVQSCLDSLQRQIAHAGIQENISYDQIRAPKVKERALKLGIIQQ